MATRNHLSLRIFAWLFPLFFVFFQVSPLLAQTETSNDTTPTAEQLKGQIQEFFDEVLDVDVGWDALQIRHISNVGYGIDNAIGLNGELRDTLAFARQVLQSEMFVRSLLQYDHFWARTLNRKNYSPKAKEIERKFDEPYNSNLKFDIVFTPAWDTVNMTVDEARTNKLIAYNVQIKTQAHGTIETRIDQEELTTLLNEALEGQTYNKIGGEAKPAVNASMFDGVGFLVGNDTVETDDSNIERIEFTLPSRQAYGFDAYDNEVLAGNYDQVEINGKVYYIPWKSVAKSGTDSLRARVVRRDEEQAIGDTAQFKTGTGVTQPAQVRSGALTYNITTTPLGVEGMESLLATYTITTKDGSTEEVEAGRVNLVVYEKLIQKVVLVPVNGIDGGVVPTDIKNALDTIYKQAVVEWDVQLASGITVPEIYDDNQFQDGGTGVFSNYTEEMKKVIKVFDNSYPVDKNTCYLFLLNKPESSGKLGSMPMKKQFGFIYVDNASGTRLAHTIAHELGHGPFRLYHTFSEKNDYYQGKGQTNNLMDYKDPSATRLYKYQWDYIHDPQAMISWLQDDSEGASVLSDVFSIVELIRDAALNNKECKIPIYSHSVIDNIYDVASDKTIKEDIARRYSGLKFQIQFDESSIEKKVCAFNFDDVEIQAYDLSQTNPVYDFQSSVSIVTKDEKKRALVTFNCNKSNVVLVKEFLFGDVEKDCAPIIEGITKNLNENKEVDLSELSASCAAKIPLETRKKLVNYILNKWWVSEKYEHALLVLIEQVQDENVDGFISYLRNDKLDDKFVYQQLMSAINDINGKDYYAALMQVFTRLLLRQSEYASGEPELKEIILVGKKPWFNISEIPEFEYRYEKKPSYNSAGDIDVTYKIRLMTDAQLKKTPAYTTSPTGAPVKQLQVTYLDKTFVWKSDNLSYTYDPLSLVFVAKQSETANVEDILQEETAEGVIVPAVLLMYNSDKVMQQNIEQGVYITLDAATILLSGGTLAYVKAAGKVISKTRKALLLLEIANGVVNLTVNLSELSVNPEAQKFLFYYNLGTAGFNLACSAKNIKWLRQGGKVLDGCENISETLVRRMSKYEETKRVGFFNDFSSDKSLLNQVDNLSDAEFDQIMKSYLPDLDADARKAHFVKYLYNGGEKLYLNIDEFKVAISRGDNVFYVGKHMDISPRPTGVQSHHGVNSVLMENRYSNYNPNKAPSVYMLNDPNHNATRVIFNQWRAEMAKVQGLSKVDYAKITKEDIIKLAEKQFDAAEVPKVVRDEYYKIWEEYIKTLTPK